MIELDECRVGGIYDVKARNFQKAVYVGDGYFAGIRSKFGQRFIDYEEYGHTAFPKVCVGMLSMERYPIPWEHSKFADEERAIFDALDSERKKNNEDRRKEVSDENTAC